MSAENGMGWEGWIGEALACSHLLVSGSASLLVNRNYCMTNSSQRGLREESSIAMTFVPQKVLGQPVLDV